MKKVGWVLVFPPVPEPEGVTEQSGSDPEQGRANLWAKSHLLSQDLPLLVCALPGLARSFYMNVLWKRGQVTYRGRNVGYAEHYSLDVSISQYMLQSQVNLSLTYHSSPSKSLKP